MFSVKRISIVVYIISITITGKSQARTEIGLNTGLSVYYGDLNESALFYSPKVYYGFLIKRNFDERYAVQLALNNVKLGVDEPKVNIVDQIYPVNSFDSRVWDVVLQTEFNFLPYSPLELKKDFISPYITAGVGVIFFSGGKSLTVPFGLGIKVKIDRRLGIGSEWTFRKTFTDVIDNGTESIKTDEYSSLIHNNDWFSIIGIFVTYNISKLRIDCPAYK